MYEEPTKLVIIYERTDDELDHAIAHFRHLNKQYAIAYAVETADYVVKHFYQGDYALARDRDPTKHTAFEELLLRRKDDLADLDLSPRTLRRYIAAGDVWHGLPEATRSHLGVSHLESLAAIANKDERKRIAHDAATMHWTRQQTAVKVKDFKKQERGGKKKPGRKAKPNALKEVVALRHAIKQVHKGHSAAKKLGEAHYLEYSAALEECKVALSKLD